MSAVGAPIRANRGRLSRAAPRGGSPMPSAPLSSRPATRRRFPCERRASDFGGAAVMTPERRVVTPARAAGALALVGLVALVVWLLAPPRGGIPGVLAPDSRVELVQKGFKFLEGPVGTPDGGLYFTDLPTNIVYRRDPSG